MKILLNHVIKMMSYIANESTADYTLPMKALQTTRLVSIKSTKTYTVVQYTCTCTYLYTHTYKYTHKQTHTHRDKHLD